MRLLAISSSLIGWFCLSQRILDHTLSGKQWSLDHREDVKDEQISKKNNENNKICGAAGVSETK